MIAMQLLDDNPYICIFHLNDDDYTTLVLKKFSWLLSFGVYLTWMGLIILNWPNGVQWEQWRSQNFKLGGPNSRYTRKLFI